MTIQAFLKVEKMSVGYGATTVLDDLDLGIGKGEFVALLGSSGCGKTTLLRTIAGFAKPNAGSIRVAGRDVTHMAPDKRGMALVFQSYALWPHMTVAQNIGYGLKLQKRSREEIDARIKEMQDLLGLSGLGSRKPGQLSGGQRQRVALGRALAIDPEILLLDEPLSNLDARIRLTVRHEIRSLQKRLGITAIHVTHDREEAMVMADRIVIMNAGRIEQQGSPEAVYNMPASPFVAAFMGAENILSMQARVSGEQIELHEGAFNASTVTARNGRDLRSGPVELRFRAEAARLTSNSATAAVEPGALELRGQVTSVSYPGGHWRHAVRLGVDEILVDSDNPFGQGEIVKISVPATALFIFNASSEGTAH
ncbi:ABC transporter ATP-binding protein [Phyllobacterium lublinensis]|uniref:ABC transporter ATP-binding protein n=1 Tax=Phyllobacterium lublinensis TaxID=2875708 RepID=UPI001CCF2B75|nr:ABC transporter ATP-binding protein [Phyllobacterium sp. 2063]MBZ9656012.1 ABC transporter ATP-binding protein [Phyllobacterium sp. 2063]